MKWSYISIIILLLSTNVFAQNSFFEDSKGEGAFKINDNVISINSAEQSIKLNYFRPIVREKYFPNKFGITVNAIANSGVSTLFNEGSLDPTGEISFYYTAYGKNEPKHKINERFDYFIFSGGLKLESVSLIDTTNFGKGSFDEKTPGFSLEVAYNRVGYLFKRENSDGKDIWENTLFGVSVSYDLGDNADEVSQSEYILTNIIESSATQTITEKKDLKGLISDDYMSSRGIFNLNMDAGILPSVFSHRLLFSGHYRGKAIEDQKYISNMGLGVYLTHKDASTKILGGLNFMIEDFFGIETNNSISKRLGISIVAGFNI
ncbi:hypothetical protein [Gracilimonas sp.]